MNICFFLLGPVIALLTQTTNLQTVRMLYQDAAIKKATALKLHDIMQQIDSSAAPVLVCYKGAIEMIQAKYVLNPFSKLEKFNRGKRWIATAISKDTTDLEMRFIRLGLERNSPSFLGYRDDIERDKHFLITEIKSCADTGLKRIIINYLISSGDISAREGKGLYN